MRDEAPLLRKGRRCRAKTSPAVRPGATAALRLKERCCRGIARLDSVGQCAFGLVAAAQRQCVPVDGGEARGGAALSLLFPVVGVMLTGALAGPHAGRPLV